jgi:hypothetical protein
VATECHIQFSFRFQPKLTLDFAGGEITSEAGLVLLRELHRRTGHDHGLQRGDHPQRALYAALLMERKNHGSFSSDECLNEMYLEF